MQNPYPELKQFGVVAGLKVKSVSHYAWQEGYDAKEKEDQGLYEALEQIAKLKPFNYYGCELAAKTAKKALAEVI